MGIEKDARKGDLAQNECCFCAFRWFDLPGALAKLSECPKCLSSHWRWLNFEEFVK